MTEFLLGASLSQKAIVYALLISAIVGLTSLLGSLKGWRLLSVYSFSIPCGKISELDNQWDKITKRVLDSIFSLPKTTRFFPEAWFHRDVEHRSIQIFSRSIENINFIKDRLGKIKNIKEGRESIFWHLSKNFGTGNTNMYRCINYRRFVVKLDWKELRKRITPLKLELEEHYEKTDNKIKINNLKKESFLDLEADLEHGELSLSMFFDNSSNIHLFFHYFETARQVVDCRITVGENWKMITDSLEKIFRDKYTLKEKAGSGISDEVITGKRYLVMNSWGMIPELK